MKPQLKLKKRLKQYSILTSSILVSALAADAQVIYTDVNPDFFNEDGNWFLYSLDLNNDGITEINLKGAHYDYYWTSSAYVFAEPNSGVFLAVTNGYPAMMEKGETIGASLNWINSNGILALREWDECAGCTSFSSSFGNWNFEEMKFLAIRFTVNSQQHYGWARLSVTQEFSYGAYWQLTVHDYAYGAIPESSIAAGQIDCVEFYADEDGDQYGDVYAPTDTLCELPDSGYSTVNTDCNDSDSTINPAATEIINNSMDDDCDGLVDEFGVGISSLSEDRLPFSIFPNPAIDAVTIQFILNQAAHVKMILCDVNGRQMEALMNKQMLTGKHSFPFSTLPLPKGVYVIKMISDSGIENRKLVVE